MSKEQDKLNEDIYMSLGKFVVSFSHLLHALEESTIFLIGIEPSAKTMLLKSALTDRTANPISKAFFSVFFQRWEGSVTDKDVSIVETLRREIQELIEKRNRIMHDAWMSKSVGGDPGPHPMSLIRVKIHGKGANYEAKDYGPEEIGSLQEDARRLAKVVNGIVWYVRPGQSGPEVSERFEVREKKVYFKESLSV